MNELSKKKNIKILVFCATKRGLLFLQKLVELLPNIELIVFSFKEEPDESLFINNIREFTLSSGGTFYEAKKITKQKFNSFRQLSSFDLLFAVSWRFFISEFIYSRAKLGAYVLHDSLLPHNRGFSPSVWAIANGECETGVTLFKMTDEIDTGDIVYQQSISIGPNETIAELMNKTNNAYIALLEKNLIKLINGTAAKMAQNHALANYLPKRKLADNLIRWNDSSQNIFNLIRSVTQPYQGAFTYYKGLKMIIWDAENFPPVENVHLNKTSATGQIISLVQEKGALVSTGSGTILIKKIQIGEDEPVHSLEIFKSAGHILGK